MALTIDFNALFPLSEKTNTRSPLPKQNEFFYQLLDPLGPKYVAYVGGIGSGKSLIGCISMLAMAVLYPGDYVVAREYMPQLRDTTWKTFLELCPPELIHEIRVADAIISVKASGGKKSNIFFRGLEEADKLRSMNLSGFLIDEANQVSEESFMLLQGRLRGRGLRKGMIVSNPSGHDWMYRWFVKKDHITTPDARAMYSLIKAPSTENFHLPDGYISNLMASWSLQRIQREIDGSFDSFEGAVYEEFRRDVHVIKPFRVPDDWTTYVGMDHGFRNPAAAIFASIDYDDNIYVWKELYKSGWLIEELCKGREGEAGIIDIVGKRKITEARIDPSTKANRGRVGGSDWDLYMENLPKDFPLLLANNEVATGIERVKQLFKLDEKTKKPKIYIFDTCSHLIEELVNYRYEELRPGQEGKRNAKEAPRKKDDHAVDALRYLVMALPDAPKKEDSIHLRLNQGSVEMHLWKDFQEAKKPKAPKDIFDDGI